MVAGIYRVELTLFFSDGTTIGSHGDFNLQPAGLPIPVSGLDGSFRWTAEAEAVDYDVWVAYLGQPNVTNPVVPPKRKFDTIDGVTSGTYQLPVDASAGNYRIWTRPNFVAAGLTTKGAWSASLDFTSQGPPSGQIKVTVQNSQSITWAPTPGATRYRFSYGRAGTQLESVHSEHFATTFNVGGIPEDLPDGAYDVWVQSLDSNGIAYPANPLPTTVQHIGSPVSLNIWNDSNSISWDSLPHGDLNFAYLYDLKTGEELFYIRTYETSIPVDVPPGQYRFVLRVTRYVNDRFIFAKPVTKVLDLGVPAASNIQLSGTTLSWDGPSDAKYSVTIGTKNGRLDTIRPTPDDNMFIDEINPYPWHSNYPVRSTTFEASGNNADLQSYIRALYSLDPTATLVVAVLTKVKNPGSATGDILSVASAPVEFKLPQKPLWTEPIVERVQQNPPSAPVLGETWGSLNHNTVAILTLDPTLPLKTGSNIYRTENGMAVDLQFASQYEFRITNVLTGGIQTFDESQGRTLMQIQDLDKNGILGHNFESNVPYDIVLTRLLIPLKWQFGLSDGVYRIESRVQFLPVILPAATSDPYIFDLTDTPPDHINVAATPWSDWSVPFEYTVLPDGQNILPITKSPGTVESRPTFAWSSNTSNAKYEVWVENRATKQRVIHETLTDVRQFKPTTNLPPGQYDWWVRIVGTTGIRNGWSPKQSLEVYAPVMSTNVVTETADATPVVSWTAVTGAQLYVVTLTSTTTGKVVYTANAASSVTSHRVATTLPNDTYTASIQALLPNGARTAPGVADSGGGFVLKRMIVGGAPKGVVITSPRVLWQAVAGATKYDVWIDYISPTGKTERVFRQDSFGTEIRLPSSLTSRAGEYRVWIRAIRSEAGQEYVGRWSDVKTLTVASISSTLNTKALTLVMSEMATSGLQM